LQVYYEGAGPAVYAALARLPQVRHLDLTGSVEMLQLECLEGMGACLTSLTLCLEGPTSHRQLKWRVEDVASLLPLTRLRNLTLISAHLPSPSDAVAPGDAYALLSQLSSVTHLMLDNVTPAPRTSGDFPPLLRDLALSGFWHGSPNVSLAGLKKLERLSLADMPASITLPHTLSDLRVEGFQTLAGLNRLQGVRRLQIREGNLSAASSFANLTQVRLSLQPHLQYDSSHAPARLAYPYRDPASIPYTKPPSPVSHRLFFFPLDSSGLWRELCSSAPTSPCPTPSRSSRPG
jgi:hypothetical protein